MRHDIHVLDTLVIPQRFLVLTLKKMFVLSTVNPNVRGGEEEGDQVSEEERVGHGGPEQRHLAQHYDTD